MHLGGGDTGRYEIQVFCWRCWPIVRREYKGKRYVVWRIGDAEEDVKRLWPDDYKKDKKFVGKYVVVVALTDNAWENREVNHPNLLLEMEATEVGCDG